MDGNWLMQIVHGVGLSCPSGKRTMNKLIQIMFMSLLILGNEAESQPKNKFVVHPGPGRIDSRRAVDQPYSIKSLVAGASLESVLRDPQFTWSRPEHDEKDPLDTVEIHDFQCERFTVAETKPGYVSINFAKAEGVYQAYMISISISPDQFYAVKEALLMKYGLPTTDEEFTVQNGMGANFKNEKARWINRLSLLELEKYGPRIDGGYITLFDRGLYASITAKHEQLKRIKGPDI